jgi:glycosyltransferase involved in cell wall biosynthesis
VTPLRTLHVLPRVIAESSGPSHTVPRLCRALSERGLEVELKVLEPLPDRALAFPATAYPTLTLPGCYRLGVSPGMARSIRSAAARVDVIHGHSLWMMPNIYPGPAARRAGCKLVISPRGTLESWAWQRSRWRKHLVWRMGQHSTVLAAHLLHATAVSEYESIRARGLTQPVAVIPNGVEIPSEVSLRRETGARSLLYLSRIHPKKQVDRLLRVWSRIEPGCRDWRLVIAGPLSASYAVSMLRLAHELGLQRVEFPGELVGQTKWQALAAADIFVLPTRSENFGLAIAESLAAGTPVVTTHGAPWSGLVQRRCGWWTPDDEASLEATLHEAMGASHEERVAMGRRGRAWMKGEFSWDGVAERMAASYSWLLGRADRPAWIVD